LKHRFNSAYKPLVQQFFMRPSTVSLQRVVLRWLQTMDVSMLCRGLALFSMPSPFPEAASWLTPQVKQSLQSHYP
jgi:hypothetical protein